ncbi:MAG: DinB family protein [Armatimonadetes bacterium]|nr:DinB family protein [Armatimonadota bacterium]
MRELHEVWKFGRVRLAQSIEGISDEQLRWRPYEGGHNIAEILYHIAGAEHYWANRIVGWPEPTTEADRAIDQAVIMGFLREGAFPIPETEFTGDAIESALGKAAGRIEPVFLIASEEMLSRPITSPIGDTVRGSEGLVRLAQHASYHTGQIWLMRMMPTFPTT